MKNNIAKSQAYLVTKLKIDNNISCLLSYLQDSLALKVYTWTFVEQLVIQQSLRPYSIEYHIQLTLN